MSGTLYIAASGALARFTDLEVVANNLANADTIGFKRDRMVFDAALEGALRRVDGRPVPGAAGQVYVDTSGSTTEFRAGGVQPTGAPLDVAISGPGFFEIQTPEGQRYTRAGSFLVSAQRQITTADGYPVLGDGGPIEVGSRPVEILGGGQVVDDSGAVIGRLSVVQFEDPSGLRKVGRTLFEAPPDAAPAALPAELIPRSLERSNVEPVKELGALVVLQRLYDITLQSLNADDEATRRLIQEVSG
jgi:flagellar basal body rod protein FlgG